MRSGPPGSHPLARSSAKTLLTAERRGAGLRRGDSGGSHEGQGLPRLIRGRRSRPIHALFALGRQDLEHARHVRDRPLSALPRLRALHDLGGVHDRGRARLPRRELGRGCAGNASQSALDRQVVLQVLRSGTRALAEPCRQDHSAGASSARRTRRTSSSHFGPRSPSCASRSRSSSSDVWRSGRTS